LFLLGVNRLKINKLQGNNKKFYCLPGKIVSFFSEIIFLSEKEIVLLLHHKFKTGQPGHS